MENEKKDCPVVDIEGLVTNGKQFDLDITIPEDNRNLIYGVIKNCYREPIEDAAVKLIEVTHEYGKKIRKPVSHTFTDKNGEFIFGPLCPNKFYEIKIWVNDVKHEKVCIKCKHDSTCLKGIELCECHKPRLLDENGIELSSETEL